MCGFVIAKSGLITTSSFKNALDKIQYRGPDDSKIVESHGFTFGFNRLSIQDLSEFGSQPMKDSQGNLLCFNGEIYNFHSLREDLKKNGEKFQSDSDSEVLLKLLATYGISKTLEMIDGMYAFVYLDASLNKMFACRDPFGMKPLFFHNSEGGIVFSSEIKSILPLINSINIDIFGAINPLFFNGLSSDNRTLFDKIKTLEAGYYLEYCLNTKSHIETQFFDLGSLVNSSDYLENAALSNNELTEKIEAALERSVKSHLVSDVKAGILFSAGLDSSLISALASKLTNDPLDLFKYQSDNLDDFETANNFASQFGAELHISNTNDSDIIFNLPHLIYSYEMLNKADGSALSMVCSDAYKKDYKVLLTGDAADEVFAGYPSFENFRTHSYLNQQLNLPKINKLINKIIPGFRGLLSESLHHLISPFDDRFLKPFIDFTLFEGESDEEFSKSKDAYSFVDNDHELRANSFLLDEVKSRLERFLIRSDRVGMANSIELRTPFLSKELVALALNIPFNKRSIFLPSIKQRRMFRSKYPLRTLAKKLNIGASIIDRPKVGTPSGEVNYENMLKVGNHIKYSNIENIFGIKRGAVIRFLSKINYRPAKERLYWAFISLEILIRMFLLKETPHEVENEFREILH